MGAYVHQGFFAVLIISQNSGKATSVVPRRCEDLCGLAFFGLRLLDALISPDYRQGHIFVLLRLVLRFGLLDDSCVVGWPLVPLAVISLHQLNFMSVILVFKLFDVGLSFDLMVI